MTFNLLVTLGRAIRFIILLLVCLPSIVGACGDVTLLELTDRGSVTNTPCTLPPQALLLEAGYQYQTSNPIGAVHTFPQPVLFLGLPTHNELIVGLPSFNQRSTPSGSGYSTALLGVKHEFALEGNWGAATEFLLIPPSGSRYFGTPGIGITLNGIVSYAMSPKLNAVLMVGENRVTEAQNEGGEYFYTFNASLAVAYKPIEKIVVFAELFTQSKTSPQLGANYNIDGGVLYLWMPNIVFDVEVGEQLSQQDEHFNRFISGGISMQFAI